MDGTSGYQAFFGYPSQPELLRETVANAARRVEETTGVRTQSWEGLSVGGRLVITEVLKAIKDADISVFEVSDLNQNVMFELGFAIGAEKRVFLLRDPTDEHGERKWKQLRVLTSIGYSPYSNSEDIRISFQRESPHLSADTIFSQSIAPSLQPALFKSVFYVASPHNNEAERDIRRRVNQEQRHGLAVTMADATESSAQSLSWFGEQIYGCAATIVHLLPPRRQGAEIHNARAAFVSGLCHGLGRPLLMVAPDDYPPPLDYLELLYVYRTARDCTEHVDRWLTKTLSQAHADARDIEMRRRKLNLATELRSLRLGDPVAENEAELLSEYFLETSAFDDVLNSSAMIFVGRKGTGKSANFLRAAEVLGADRRNLVVAIKPFGYELDGIVQVVNGFTASGSQDFLVESLWKFLLLSEISLAAATELGARSAPVEAGTPEYDLEEYLRSEEETLAVDFAVRLERAIASLDGVSRSGGVDAQRAAITEALHGTQIANLRRILGPLLQNRRQVAVLVDNLDQSWDRSRDLDALTVFLLGLLTAISRIETDFRRSDAWRQPVPLTIGIFLRSDIFAKIVSIASEPDKIPYQRIVWEDPQLLLRVVEERYAAARAHEVEGSELWSRYFAPTVDGILTRNYILWRILRRPRDLVYFCNAAITTAINRRHEMIDEEDIREAERLYSQFALEALLVEDEAHGGDLEAVLYEFSDSAPVLTDDDVRHAIELSRTSRDVAEIVRSLRVLSFLGIEVREGVFAYSDDPRKMRQADVIARRLAERRGVPPRYRIHPAFRPYLEIEDGIDGPSAASV